MQSEKCDPDGDYIRRYVPELRNVKGKGGSFWNLLFITDQSNSYS